MSNKPSVQAYLHVGIEGAGYPSGQRGVSLNYDEFCTNIYTKTEPLILLSDYEARVAELEHCLHGARLCMAALIAMHPMSSRAEASLLDECERIDVALYKHSKKG